MSGWRWTATSGKDHWRFCLAGIASSRPRGVHLFGLPILEWLRQLDGADAVGLARALIHAEAGRLRLPLDHFSMSGRVNVRDDGIDGRTDFPLEAETSYPRGPYIWQVKSGQTLPSAAAEILAANRSALRNEISDGNNYALFWTFDPTDPAEQTIRSTFQEAVASARSGGSSFFIFADRIERLCQMHPAVLARAPNLPLSGLIGIDRWRGSFEADYEADDARRAHIEIIRDYLNSTAAYGPLHVFGDIGVGKSRLVYEALDDERFRDRVLVAMDAQSLSTEFLSFVVNSSESHLLLVVDECGYEDRKRLTPYIGMSEGRIQLITIGPRSTRESQADDTLMREVLPLDAAASKEIALAVGVSESDADLVAQFTEGYPGLARDLARTIRSGDPNAGLIERIRGEAIDPVLAAMLTEPSDVACLGLLSLFERLGFDEDFATETSIACNVFATAEANFRQVVDRETDRYVSKVGRYRQVTPRLLAVWLAQAFMRQNSQRLVEALRELPESMRERVLIQMEAFAGDEHVEEVLRELESQAPFVDSPLGDVDEGAGRLLHVTALVAPELASATLARVFAGRTMPEVRGFVRGRREVVSSLDLLLWFETTFERAADILLMLAVGENETWANNATGVLAGVFHVFLGGTAVPLIDRVAWARRSADRFGDASKVVLLKSLAQAFDLFESRSSPNFGPRAAPLEWRPETTEQEIASRGAAWDLIVDLGLSSPSLPDEVSSVVASSLSAAIARGLQERVLRDIPAIATSPTARTAIADALSRVLDQQPHTDESRSALFTLREELLGVSLEQRLAFVLAAPPFKLSRPGERRSGNLPSVIGELAGDVVTAARISTAAAESRSGDHDSSYLLFREIGRLSSDPAEVDAVEELRPVPAAALKGLFVGASEALGEEATNTRLLAWLADPDLAPLVVPTVHNLPPTPLRADLAVAAVLGGAAVPSEVGRLLYGAWARHLPAQNVEAIVRVLLSSESRPDLESAMGILVQWLEEQDNRGSSSELFDIGSELVTRSSSSEYGDPSGMLPVYRQEITNRLNLGFEQRMRSFLAVMTQTGSFLDRHDLSQLENLCQEQPDTTAERVIGALAEAVTQAGTIWPMWVSDATILSLLGRHCGQAVVVRELDSVDRVVVWPHVLGHVDFTGGEPDPVLVHLIDAVPEEVAELLRARATFHFMYPEGGWTGPESSYLSERVSVAQRWRAEATSESFASWMDQVLAELPNSIQLALDREAERGF
jgi:hypothetical protein